MIRTLSNKKNCQYIGTGKTQPGACDNVDMHAWSSYCQHHHPMIYQEGSAVRKRKKDIRVAENTFDLIAEFESVIAEIILEEEA